MMAGRSMALVLHGDRCLLIEAFHRFTDHKLDYVNQKRELKNLAQTFLSTFSDLGLEAWLVHGSLLGWWWNKKAGLITSLHGCRMS